MNAEFFNQMIERRDLALLQQIKRARRLRPVGDVEEAADFFLPR